MVQNQLIVPFQSFESYICNARYLRHTSRMLFCARSTPYPRSVQVRPEENNLEKLKQQHKHQ